MPLVDITPPPGVVKPGTTYAAKGRWFSSLWVRWFEGVMQAIDGFEAVQIGVSPAQVDAGERVSGTWGWKDNDDYALLAYGGPSLVKILRTGAEYDITPVGFTAGTESAVMASGAYGTGVYSHGIYGVGDQVVEQLVEAQSYSMDNYGEDLVFCAVSDGKLYYCDTDGNAGAPAVATALTNAPTGLIGVVVTPERFIMALGGGGDPRFIQWADQDVNTDWTPTSANQAGDIRLPGKGTIMAGRRSQAETLVWTDADLFSIRYIAGTYVYQAVPVGAVGAISRRAMAVVGSVAYWMSDRGFYVYNGYTEAISSPLADHVFSNLNRNQASKIWCETRQEYGEITWHYPSGGSDDCDRSVTFNYEEGHWFENTVARTAGEDRGAIPYPVAFDPAGLLWRHEVGSNYGGASPTVVSGPMELGKGDQIMHVQTLLPDEKTLGDVDIYLLTGFFPTMPEGTPDEEVTHGPYTPANPTDVRLTARQIRLKIVQDQPGWRVGVLRADVEPGGLR